MLQSTYIDAWLWLAVYWLVALTALLARTLASSPV